MDGVPFPTVQNSVEVRLPFPQGRRRLSSDPTVTRLYDDEGTTYLKSFCRKGRPCASAEVPYVERSSPTKSWERVWEPTPEHVSRI